MKYTKLSLQYMKRRWLYVLAYSILPAIVFTLTSKPVSIFNAIVSLKDNTDAKFIDVWLGATEISLKGFLLLILSGLLLIVFASAFCGLMERDMRLGDLTNKKFFGRVNNNFLIVFKIFFVFVIMLELFGVMNSALIYLWYRISRGNYIVFTVLASTSLTILSIVFVAFAALGILWIPTMIVTGLNMRKSLVEALQLIKGKVFKMIFNILLPLVPFYAVVMVCNYFNIGWLCFFSELILHLFIIGYYFVLMFVTYFDATGTDREDLKKKIWEVGK